MKKVILIACMIAGSIGAFAQGFSFGLKAGLNLAKENVSASGGGFNVSASSDNYASFHAGAYATFMFTEHLGIQPELLFSSEGAKFDDETLKTSYIRIPVLFRYQIIPLVSLHTGPQIGILASAKADGDDIKDSFNSADFGWAFGAGLDLPMGLNFSARYITGLSNIAKDSDGSDGKLTNRTIQLSVGYKIFGKK